MKKYKKLPKIISVFPLSNFVIFPNTSVPLNIFEPRYIKMIDNSMKTDRIIGMIQPKKQKDGIPQLYNVGCAGKITNFNETEDGRYLIVINGISRFKILKEINNNKPYRECEISFDEYIEDTKENYNEIKFTDLELIFKNLKTLFKKKGYLINWKELEKQSLDQTLNALVMASPFSLEEKQALLETININKRKIELEKILNTYVLDEFNNKTIQ
jgi:Lon protease-like protein|tara:strand:+ start:107 stop:748 length:642 start_codon:yes stop_codon:yes gene_type:complete